MEEQGKFLEMLEDMKEIARAQDNYLTKEELKRYLGEIELSEDQWRAVYQYMGTYQIRIQGYEYVPNQLIGQDSGNSADGVTGQSHGQDDGNSVAGMSRQVGGHAGLSGSTGKKRSTGKKNSKIQEHYRRDLRNMPSGGKNVPAKEICSFLKGNMDSRERIIESRLYQVVEIAEQYARYSLPLEELVAEGNLGLLHGMKKAESERERLVLPDGTANIQDFLKLLEQEVIRAIEGLINQETESKGQETAMLAKTNLLHESAKYLAGENGKIPTVQELSDYTKVPVEEIRQIMDLSEDAKRVAKM